MRNPETFIRNIRLTIGPGREGDAFRPGKALEFFSDGSRGGLKINFNIIKTILGAPNQSTIEIYNLSLDNRRRVAKELESIRLFAGWENTSLVKIASGGLLSAVSSQEGADIKTALILFDGYAGIIKGVAQKTFGPGVKISAIVEEVAKELPGVVVSPERIRVTGSTGSRGRIINGRASDELNRLAEEFGFSWSVQFGQFQAIDDNQVFNKIIEVSPKINNLFSAHAILSGPAQVNTGVEIVALLNPSVLPGDQVKLTSEVDPDLNGTYKIHNLSFQGGTFDADWKMTIQSFRVF